MGASNVAGTIKPPDLTPAISPNVHLSLTIAYLTLYGLLFLIVYVQLWMILYYKHKRLSYQTVFLFLCLFWAGLRTTLFSFYFKNCLLANNLGVIPYWLLYCFPPCLQFISLCLLVLFFASVVFRAKEGYETRFKKPLWIGTTLGIAIFLITNITCAVLGKLHRIQTGSDLYYLSLTRVVINDSLFILAAIALSFCLYSVSHVSSTSVVLEAKGTTVHQALAACILVIVLYVTRAVYNMIAISKSTRQMLSFGYGWINVSDQADSVNLTEGFAYLSFGIVLFVWEFLPTFVVVMFFRVKKPNNDLPVLSSIRVGNRTDSRAYFFDNPRRYDSDDDLSRSHISRISNGDSSSSGDPFTLNSRTGSLINQYGGLDQESHYTNSTGVLATLPQPNFTLPNQRQVELHYDGT